MNQLYPIIRRIRRPLLPPDDPPVVRHLTPSLSPVEAERVGESTVAMNDQASGSPEPLGNPHQRQSGSDSAKSAVKTSSEDY